MSVRPAAVAGMFYSADPKQLQQDVGDFLESNPCSLTHSPKALVVPHAGLIYSGPIAASAYNLIQPIAEQIERVVLLGPAHRVPLAGIALSGHQSFRTPLGEVELDRELAERISQFRQVEVVEQAHAMEHCLEVQLPFLQTLLPSFKLLPLVVGHCRSEQVVEVLEQVWGGPETLLLFSSDLSHYHSYNEARQLDQATCDQLCRLEGVLQGEQACGCYALNGLIAFARQNGFQVEALDLRNSGDTAGDRERVVGYGAFAVY